MSTRARGAPYRRGALWWVASVSLLFAFILGSGLEVLHFALVSHRWCELHQQLEHDQHDQAPLTVLPPGKNSAQEPRVAVTIDPPGSHGDHTGCAVLSARNEKATVAAPSAVSAEVGDVTELPWICGASFAFSAVPLSFAPKRSPPAQQA